MSDRLPPAGLRVPRPLLDRADRLLDYVAETSPEMGADPKRADVLRLALARGLAELERAALTRGRQHDP